MANMKVASVQQASLVVGVLAMATDGGGLSGDSQVKKHIKDMFTKNWCTLKLKYLLLLNIYICDPHKTNRHLVEVVLTAVI